MIAKLPEIRLRDITEDASAPIVEVVINGEVLNFEGRTGRGLRRLMVKLIDALGPAFNRPRGG